MDLLVSIIMPAYNAAYTIEESIVSVLTQTYKNFELIVIDDCSSDSTSQIVEKFLAKDKRIRLIKQEKNKGVAEARNAGLNVAQGDFLAFLDSDDKWIDKKLELQIDIFKSHEVDVVYGAYFRFNNDGIKNIVEVPESLDRERLLRGNPIGNLTAIYDFRKHPLVRQKKIGHEDYLFWLEIFYNNSDVKGIGIKKPIAYYRVAESGESLSSNKFKAAQWTWTIYRKHLKLSFSKTLFYFLFYVFRAISKRV